jgi:hypothetical protein
MIKKKGSHLLRFLPLAIILVAAIVLAVMFFSGGMVKVTAWYLIQFILPITGLIGLIYSIIRSIIVKRIDKIVIITGVISLMGIAPVFMLLYPPTFPASLEHTFPSATVRLPADGPLKVAWGGDTKDVNQHVIVPDQRWAYDFVIEPYFTGSSNLTDSTGNHVVIQLDETGTYLLIAHMMPGSVTVTPGQHVVEGQVIGKCGNSGNSSEPHIHIHHQRQNPSEYPINFAEGLPLFFRDHNGLPMPVGGFRVIEGTEVATGDTVIHQGNP